MLCRGLDSQEAARSINSVESFGCRAFYGGHGMLRHENTLTLDSQKKRGGIRPLS